MLKKILSLVLTFAMLLTLGLGLASCSDETDENDDGGSNVTPGENGDEGGNTNAAGTAETYTVTVKDSEGNPVSGAKLAKVDANGNVYDSDDLLVTTDSEGKAEFSLKNDTWQVKVVSIPKKLGGILPTTVYSFSDKAVTITVSLLPKYTVRVVDQNGDVVVGATVQMCIPGGSCVPIGTTDENGEASIRMAADGYQGDVTSLPEGYAEYTGGYVDFTGDETTGFTVTITVTKN